jgi:5-methylcytosine-specific restriction endonuclease McrA
MSNKFDSIAFASAINRALLARQKPYGPGISIRQAASEIGIKPTTLFRAMKGQAPSLKKCGVICDGLGLDIWQFIGDDYTAKSPSVTKQLASNPRISKSKLRSHVFHKYGGRCAYCGIGLCTDWNVDHIRPKAFGGDDTLSNLNPSCKDCNNYKRHTDLQGFRNQLHAMLNENLECLFISRAKMQVAMNMGAIKRSQWDGKFYFERIEKD